MTQSGHVFYQKSCLNLVSTWNQSNCHCKKPRLEAKQCIRFDGQSVLLTRPTERQYICQANMLTVLKWEAQQQTSSWEMELKQYGRETAKQKSRARVQPWRQGPCVSTAQDTQRRVRLLSVLWPSLRGTNSMRHGSPPPRSSTTLCCCPAFILQCVASRLDEEGEREKGGGTREGGGPGG